MVQSFYVVDQSVECSQAEFPYGNIEMLSVKPVHFPSHRFGV